MSVAKKIVSSYVATSVLCASLMAGGNASDLIKDNFMINTTPAQEWKDVKTGKTYYTGGNGVYKFIRERSYPTWFDARSPKASISCSGFSYDLGFLGIMDLKGIEEQLSHAGEAFMWGLLTVFKLSTPNLEAIFEYIQKIVRKIQSILRDSCHHGEALAASFAKDSKIDVGKYMDDFLLSETPDEVKQHQQNSVTEKIDSFLKGVDTFGKEKKNDALASASSGALQDLSNLNSINTPISIIDATVRSVAEDTTTERVILDSFGLKKLLDQYKVSVGGADKDLIIPSSSTKQRVTNLAFLQLYIGGMPLVSVDTYKDVLVQVPDSNANDADYKKQVKDLMVKAMSSTKGKKQERKLVESKRLTAKEIVNFLMNGGTASLPDYKVITFVMPQHVVSGISSPRYAYFIADALESTNTIDRDMQGMLKGSLLGINYLSSRFSISEVGQIYMLKEGKVTVNPDDIKVPIMVDGFIRKVNIIDDAIRQNKPLLKSMAEKYAVKLVRNNALKASKSILESMIGLEYMNKGVPDGKTTDRYKIVVEALGIINSELLEFSEFEANFYKLYFRISNKRIAQ